ncbi:MAG: hypothetical protein R2784_12315 [Saprospiraceae bacterium]
MGLNVRKVSQLQGHNGAIFSVFADKSEEYIYTTGGDGWLVQWNTRDTETGKLIAKTDVQNFCGLKAKEDLFVCGNMNGGIHWIHPGKPENQNNILHHKKGVFKILKHKEDVYSLGGNGTISLWDLEKEKPVQSLQLSASSLRSICYGAKNDELILGGSDHSIYFLNRENFELTKVLKNAHQNSVFSLCLLEKRNILISGGRDAMLHFWDLNTSEPVVFHKIPAHLFTVNCIVHCPEPGLIATASRDKTIKLWDDKSFELVKVLEGLRDGGHYNSVNDLCWLPKNKMLVSVGDDRMGQLWKFE